MEGVLVSQLAPDFNAPAVLAGGEIIENYNLSENIRGKYAALFFYPLDFTFVCPTEILAIDRRVADFKRLGVEVIAISIDSHFTHNAWRNTPVKDGGIGPVNFTMVADITHDICMSYDVEHPEAGVAFRGTFIIDKEGIVRSQTVNDLPLGRNIDETVRTIKALQYHEKHGEVCPAGWQEGDSAMEPTPSGVAQYLSSESDKL